MHPLVLLLGIFLAMLMDLGSGILITNALIHWLGEPSINITPWTNYVSNTQVVYGLGMFFALLPDIDLVIPLAKKFLGKFLGKLITINQCEIDGRHKDKWTHYPIVMIPLATIVMYRVAPFCSVLALCGLLSHFVHDSWQRDGDKQGGGVRWLAPFGKNYYQFFSRRAKGGKLKLVVSWTPEEVQEVFDETLEQWLSATFLKFTWENAIGIITFLLALALLAL